VLSFIEYIRHQKEHRKESFRAEYECLLTEAGLQLNAEYDPSLRAPGAFGGSRTMGLSLRGKGLLRRRFREAATK